MTYKTMMPEPVAKVTTEQYRDSSRVYVSNVKLLKGVPHGTELITTTQAEAYAEARVREALKCVSREVHSALHPTNIRVSWTQYDYIREEAAHDAESAIRALMPKKNKS